MDSFWRDFAMRVAYKGKSMRGWYTHRGKSRERKRIMNRLFISSSSVKLLRMAHPTKSSISFFIMALCICISRVSSRGNTSCFVVVCNLYLLATVAYLSYITLRPRQILFYVHKNLFFISTKKYFIFTIICHEINQIITPNLLLIKKLTNCFYRKVINISYLKLKIQKREMERCLMKYYKSII